MPYRTILEENGLGEAVIDERIRQLLAPLTEEESRIISLCLGLEKHRMPLLNEAAEELGLDATTISLAVAKFHSILQAE